MCWNMNHMGAWLIKTIGWSWVWGLSSIKGNSLRTNLCLISNRTTDGFWHCSNGISTLQRIFCWWSPSGPRIDPRLRGFWKCELFWLWSVPSGNVTLLLKMALYFKFSHYKMLIFQVVCIFTNGVSQPSKRNLSRFGSISQKKMGNHVTTNEVGQWLSTWKLPKA